MTALTMPTEPLGHGSVVLRGWRVEEDLLAVVEERGLMRLEMFIEPENEVSQRLAERCGYVREGLLRSRWFSKGRRRDSIVYGLLPTDVRAR